MKTKTRPKVIVKESKKVSETIIKKRIPKKANDDLEELIEYHERTPDDAF